MGIIKFNGKLDIILIIIFIHFRHNINVDIPCRGGGFTCHLQVEQVDRIVGRAIVALEVTDLAGDLDLEGIEVRAGELRWPHNYMDARLSESGVRALGVQRRGRGEGQSSYDCDIRGGGRPGRVG